MIVRALRRMLCPAMTVSRVLVLAGAVIGAAACGSPAASSRAAVPAEFRAACGHPGAQVNVRKVPVTVSHAACDLTGVMITYRDYGGAVVPRGGGGTSIGNSSGFRMAIHPGSLDVSVNATGVPGNL
jgi:hypothetical protein